MQFQKGTDRGNPLHNTRSGPGDAQSRVFHSFLTEFAGLGAACRLHPGRGCFKLVVCLLKSQLKQKPPRPPIAVPFAPARAGKWFP